MIDKRPAAIAYCSDEADVAAALRYGIEHGLRIAVRGGGHNGGGLGSVDDGLVIDLSAMDAIEVDAPARMVRVGGGALLKDLLEATHQHGLTVPVGIIGTTGVGGLTLGGGMGHQRGGWASRSTTSWRRTVVLADGSIVQTDAEREPELFWALRGGGGNFGVVTSFSFRCHPATTVLAGPVLYDIGDAAEVLRVVQGLPARGARRAQRVLCLSVDSPGSAVPGGVAPPQGLRRGLDAAGRGGVRGACVTRVPSATAARRDRARADTGVEHGLRRRLPAG